MTKDTTISVPRVLDACSLVGDALRDFGHRLCDLATIFRPCTNSPWSSDADGAFGLGLVSEMGGELISGTATLLRNDQTYAAAALVRQLLEIEYIVWWFGHDYENDATKWLCGSRRQRENLFKPSNLRRMADGVFDSKDYSAHCDNGGHPNPNARNLVRGCSSLEQRSKTFEIMTYELAHHAHSLVTHLKKTVEAEDMAVATLQIVEQPAQDAFDLIADVRRPEWSANAANDSDE